MTNFEKHIIVLEKYGTYCFFVFYSTMYCINSVAQNGYGPPVFKQDFGFGALNAATIGIPLPAAKTSFAFSDSVCPQPGGYTVLRSMLPVQSCFNNAWIGLTHDSDPSKDYGMMMIVNNNSSALSRLVYADTVKQPLCPGRGILY
jgi:hypothetical protein